MPNNTKWWRQQGNLKQCKQCHPVAEFATNSNSTTWWPNWQLLQVVPHSEKISKSCKWRHLVAMRNQWMKFSGVRRASVEEAPSLSYSCPPPIWLPEVHPWRCRPQRWHQEGHISQRWLRQIMIYCWNWEIWDWIKEKEYSVFTQNTVTTEWWNISLMKKGVDGQIERQTDK